MKVDVRALHQTLDRIGEKIQWLESHLVEGQAREFTYLGCGVRKVGGNWRICTINLDKTYFPLSSASTEERIRFAHNSASFVAAYQEHAVKQISKLERDALAALKQLEAVVNNLCSHTTPEE